MAIKLLQIESRFEKEEGRFWTELERVAAIQRLQFSRMKVRELKGIAESLRVNHLGLLKAELIESIIKQKREKTEPEEDRADIPRDSSEPILGYDEWLVVMSMNNHEDNLDFCAHDRASSELCRDDNVWRHIVKKKYPLLDDKIRIIRSILPDWSIPNWKEFDKELWLINKAFKRETLSGKRSLPWSELERLYREEALAPHKDVDNLLISDVEFDIEYLIDLTEDALITMKNTLPYSEEVFTIFVTFSYLGNHSFADDEDSFLAGLFLAYPRALEVYMNLNPKRKQSHVKLLSLMLSGEARHEDVVNFQWAVEILNLPFELILADQTDFWRLMSGVMGISSFGVFLDFYAEELAKETQPGDFARFLHWRVLEIYEVIMPGFVKWIKPLFEGIRQLYLHDLLTREDIVELMLDIIVEDPPTLEAAQELDKTIEFTKMQKQALVENVRSYSSSYEVDWD